MKIWISLVISLFQSTMVLGQSSKITVEDFSWISGCWVKPGKTEGFLTSEYWTKPAGMMLGIGYSLKHGRIASYKDLRIIGKGTDIFYVAKPASAKTEPFFKMSALEGK